MSSEEGKVAEELARQPWRKTGHLTLRRLGLRTLPSLPTEAMCLRSLDVSSNRLKELPEWVWDLEQLERLDLASNRFTSIGDDIDRLSNLRGLDLSENRLAAIPSQIAACTQLRTLDLYRNALEDIGALAGLAALCTLDISDNRIARLERLPSPATLASLDLSSNLLESLPPTLAELTALRKLNLSGNKLTTTALSVLLGLPLEELFLDDNALETPPVDVARISTLLRFSALGNPFREMPPDAEPLTVSQRAAAVARSHVSTRAEAGRQYLNAPSYSFDFAVAVEGTHDAKRVADLYYKRYRALPAKIELAGGQSIALGQLTRRSAFEFLDREQGRTERALVRLEPARDYETVQTGTAFVGEAVGRLGQAELVPAAPGASSISFRQAEPAAGAEAAAPRVLNVVLADREERVLAPSETLAPERDYLVRLDIGPTAAESIVAEPVAIRIDELAPSSPDGWWFDALVASSDVDVAQAAGRLFLPFTGPSWVCDCPGPEHVCSERERRPHLFVPFRTRVRTEEAILRCTIYDRNNAVQSVRVEFVVADGRVAGGTIRGVVDYSLADDVGKSELLAARELNVLSNETPGGTHTIVVKNGDRAITVYLSESEAAKVLRELRDKLTAITLGSDGTSSQYDDQNQKRPDAFIRDLKQLALLGSVLYAAVVPDRDDRAYLRERLRNRATIQISRVTKTVFPWALVYVIPRELNATWTLCPLLEQWDSHRTALAAYPDGCPFKDQHQKNVLCPYGFWGFSHLIEQPPSVRRGALRTTIRVTDPDRAVAARSLALDSALTTAHFSQLRAAIGSRLEFDDCDSLDLLRDALADPDLPLVYFYCHGKTAVVAGTQLAVRFLEIGTGDRIGPEDFSAWDEDANWGPRHWSVSAPLVFINGCETAMLSPDDVVSFVDALAGMHVAGVIGTEIAVTQRVAGEVALRFYTQWAGADNETVGMALYRTRIDLLRKGNVSGLVYTPFCSMDLALEQAG